MQSQKAVSANFTSKQILPFGFAVHGDTFPFNYHHKIELIVYLEHKRL